MLEETAENASEQVEDRSLDDNDSITDLTCSDINHGDDASRADHGTDLASGASLQVDVKLSAKPRRQLRLLIVV